MKLEQYSSMGLDKNDAHKSRNGKEECLQSIPVNWMNEPQVIALNLWSTGDAFNQFCFYIAMTEETPSGQRFANAWAGKKACVMEEAASLGLGSTFILAGLTGAQQMIGIWA